MSAYDAAREWVRSSEGGLRTGGDRPVGLVVAAIVTATVVALPAVIVPIFYLLANVQALVTGRDFASDTLNVPVLLTGLVMTVTLPVLLMVGAVTLVGRALSPKRRDRSDRSDRSDG